VGSFDSPDVGNEVLIIAKTVTVKWLKQLNLTYTENLYRFFHSLTNNTI
jgi:hypothetical protein